MSKKICLYERFLVTKRNFTTKLVKIVKISGFLKIFVQNSRFFSKSLKFEVFPGFFCLNCQIPGFSRFPGFLAIL